MFLILLSKEIREHLKTFRFGAGLITIFVLVLVSVWVLADNYVIRNNTATRLADEYAQQAREVRLPSHILPNVQRPPSPLSIFAQGEESRLGNTVQISRRSVPSEAEDNLTKNVLLASMPSFDLLLIVMFAVSLFGILLSFDSLSGERERGTLKLICALPSKRGMIYTVKFFACVIVLSIPLILSLISVLVILQFVHGIVFTPTQWAAIAMMLLASMIYGALFIAIGLLSSALSNRSSTSLALALLFWTLGVIAIPSMGNCLAPNFKPTLSPEEISEFVNATSLDLTNKRNEFIAENNIGFSSNGSDWEGAEALWWFDGYPEWLEQWMTFVRFYEPLCQERAEQIWALINKHLARKKEQHDLSSAINSIAPAFHLHKVFTAVAGTDYDSYADFLEQCRRYRQVLLSDFREKGLFDRNVHRLFTRWEMSDMQRPEQYEQRLAERRSKGLWGMDLWDPLPKDYAPAFRYQGRQQRIEATAWHIAALSIITSLLFCVGFVAFIRYDVR